MAGTAVYPILTEFVLNSETRIGLVSMVVHPRRRPSSTSSASPNVAVVHALGEYQIPRLPHRAVARDSFGRSYQVLSDGAGTHEAGATMYLRVAPALPTDVDQLVLIPPGAGGHTMINLPVA